MTFGNSLVNQVTVIDHMTVIIETIVIDNKHRGSLVVWIVYIM